MFFMDVLMGSSLSIYEVVISFISSLGAGWNLEKLTNLPKVVPDAESDLCNCF